MLTLRGTEGNGYSCSCCRQSWDVEEVFETEKDLIEYCVYSMTTGERDFSIDDIYINSHDVYLEPIDSADIELKIDKLVTIRLAEIKKENAIREIGESLSRYETELNDMDNRKNYLKEKIKELQSKL